MLEYRLLKRGVKLMSIQPRLIQRCKFKTEQSIFDFSGSGLTSDVLSLDYMGASEFEWGAVPKSLDRILKNLDHYQVYNVDEVVDLSGRPMMVLCQTELSDSVKTAALGLALGEYWLQERSELPDYIQGEDDIGEKVDTNFWWDIEHDYFIFFDNQELVLASLYNSRKKHYPKKLFEKREKVEPWVRKRLSKLKNPQ